jgi:hypothetical protein
VKLLSRNFRRLSLPSNLGGVQNRTYGVYLISLCCVFMMEVA